MEDPCSILDRVKITISHERYSWLDNTSFFSSNCLKCISKKIHMVPANGSDTSNRWMIENIGRIESSTQPYFDYAIFATCIAKITKCSYGLRLEERCLWRDLENLFKVFGKSLMWNISIIRLDRLCNIQEVRRCEYSDFVSCFFEDCKGHLTHGSFSICPSYMDSLIALLGISKMFCQSSYSIERIGCSESGV